MKFADPEFTVVGKNHPRYFTDWKFLYTNAISVKLSCFLSYTFFIWRLPRLKKFLDHLFSPSSLFVCLPYLSLCLLFCLSLCLLESFSLIYVVFSVTVCLSACIHRSLSLCYWMPQKLPQIYTVILYICIAEVAWFAVDICGNIWNA